MIYGSKMPLVRPSQESALVDRREERNGEERDEGEEQQGESETTSDGFEQDDRARALEKLGRKPSRPGEGVPRGVSMLAIRAGKK